LHPEPKVCHSYLYVLFTLLTKRRLETLPDSAFEVLLDQLERKQGSCVRRAAGFLTPYVESILDGKDYQQVLRLECVGKETLDNLDPAALSDLCEEMIPSSV
jgi:hypothetical protein